jgi:hypothetical protein
MRSAKRFVGLATALLAASCMRTVSTTTTSEVRPLRFALTDVATSLESADSALAIARSALAAEAITLLPAQDDRSVRAGPVHFEPEGELPMLDAELTISLLPDRQPLRFRVYASAVLPAGAIGGVDPRLSALTKRVAQRIQTLLTP